MDLYEALEASSGLTSVSGCAAAAADNEAKLRQLGQQTATQ